MSQWRSSDMEKPTLKWKRQPGCIESTDGLFRIETNKRPRGTYYSLWAKKLDADEWVETHSYNLSQNEAKKHAENTAQYREILRACGSK
jgi:hypothetical protein